MRVMLKTLGFFAALIGALGFSAAAHAVTPAAAPSHAVETTPSLVTKVGGGYYGRYRSRRPQVRGFRRRAGGYSYEKSDTINTYGNSRSLYGGANSYRDPMLDRQTLGGPFDHGWFFDSGTGRNGGNSPYMN